jgi:hypothetical protein
VCAFCVMITYRLCYKDDGFPLDDTRRLKRRRIDGKMISPKRKNWDGVFLEEIHFVVSLSISVSDGSFMCLFYKVFLLFSDFGGQLHAADWQLQTA